MAVSAEQAFLLLGDALDELQPSVEHTAPLTRSTGLGGVAPDGFDCLGLDSLDAIELVTILEERCQKSVPPDLEFDSLRTVGDLVDLIVAMSSVGS